MTVFESIYKSDFIKGGLNVAVVRRTISPSKIGKKSFFMFLSEVAAELWKKLAALANLVSKISPWACFSIIMMCFHLVVQCQQWKHHVWNLFKVNSEDTGMTSITLFWCFYLWLWIDFTLCVVISIVDFEQVNADWIVLFEVILIEGVCHHPLTSGLKNTFQNSQHITSFPGKILQQELDNLSRKVYQGIRAGFVSFW